MCICVHVYVCEDMCVHIDVCEVMCMHAVVCEDMYVHVNVYEDMYLYVHAHTYMCKDSSLKHTKIVMRQLSEDDGQITMKKTGCC